MKDKNTKQRKQMIKEMKKNTPGYKFSGDNLGWFYCGKEDTLDLKPTGKCRLYVDKNDNFHFPVKELNFLESFMYFILAVFIGTVIIVKLVFPLIQNAINIEKLKTCELRGDCSEVIRDINR